MKYVKASIPLLLLTFFINTCSEPQKKEIQKREPEKADLNPFNFPFDAISDIENPEGIYQGNFPCKDCNGIEQILLIKENHTYKQAYINVDSNKILNTSNGKWQIQDNRIVLSKDNNYNISFVRKEDSLYAIDIDGIQLKQPELYSLKKESFAGDIKNWESEIKSGITFTGRGMDPDWYLNIKNNIIYFEVDHHNRVLVAEKEAIERDEYSTTYHLTTNNKNWTVTIKDHFCKNGMSDAIYEYEVIVNYDSIQYSGCGSDLKN